MIGLLLSLLDRRFRYPSGCGRDRSIPESFGRTVLGIPPEADGIQSMAAHFVSTVKLSLRKRTVIGLLLSFLDRRFCCPSGRGQ